jgi:8-oxo-dGTP diphosphatase
LPGGGVEKGETTFEALEREVLEETGYKIKVGKEIGAILEYRNEFNMLQISYCYFAKAEEKISEPNYEKEEIEGGFQPLWLPIDEAIKLLENDNPTTYDGRFIVKRDLCFLKEMKL